MSIELKVTYDGSEPGLAQHRVSLSSFGEPLRLLLSALQRTASALLAQALEDPEYGSRGGKLATEAKLLDLELATVDGGCATPSFVCTTRSPASQQMAMQAMGADELDLASESVSQLLRDIDAERSGKLRNASVRRYLKSIPRGVSRQRYTAYRDGQLIGDVDFGTAALAEPPSSLSRLVKVEGNIISVGFEPGLPFISLKTSSRSIKCTATPQQIDKALPLRNGQVTAALLDGEKPTLIWIQSAEGPRRIPAVADTIEHLHSGWENTLKELAR
ncbi:MAG: hypothetical protein ABI134_14645 [Byssovorax sp.]